MRTIKPTTQFRCDWKREKKGQHPAKLDDLFQPVSNRLAADEPLPPRYRDHPLGGDWSGCRDCHIRPDLVLIYSKPDDDTLILIRLGSHSELGL